MTILHICAGWQKWNGAANIARMIMDEQRREGHEVFFATWAKVRDLRAADEVWIHCGWLPCLWWAAFWAKRACWMPEACYDPIRLKFSAWKKKLAGPVERWALRRCEKIVATCEAEKGWIEAYLGEHCPKVEVTDVKRFFSLGDRSQELGVSEGFSRKERKDRKENEGNGSKQETGNKKLNLLYLGRRHPLKGVEFLEAAVAELGGGSRSRESKSNSGIDNSFEEKNLSVNCSTSNFDSKQIELRIVSNAFGEEKEKVWDWCDVLVLPTLSENFGLVIAEALERGKRVITTDGAPVWNPGDRGQELGASDEVGEGEDSSTSTLNFDSNILNGYDGRLLYLKGYRDGFDEDRILLLNEAIKRICK